jgi:hypothetical protein
MLATPTALSGSNLKLGNVAVALPEEDNQYRLPGNMFAALTPLSNSTVLMAHVAVALPEVNHSYRLP